ncbi:MAG TPA: nitrilase-related carbon-nitrogen hydrolase [Terriglobales bacterium]|nr:nitrilase-related carbon-nitrogen hydrolase [Terriglobales bacterium]
MPDSDRRSWGATEFASLIASVVFSMFSNGRFPVATCAWLVPVFMLHFTRRGKASIRLPLSYLGLSFAFGYQFYGMTPFAGIGYVLFSAAFGIMLLLPYLADRYILARSQGLARSLVFPAALVVSEYLSSLNPFGSWGSIAYSQYEYLPFLQLLSIAGLYSITFMIGWSAAVVNAWWENDFDTRKAGRELIAFGVVFVLASLYGEGRLTLRPPNSPTIRVASITRPDESQFPYPPSADLNRRVMMGEPLSDLETAQLEQRTIGITNFLLSRADIEAQAGAKVITFGEFNFPVLEQFKPELIAEAEQLARARGIYLALPLAVFDIGHKPPLEDKLVMIEPSGAVAWEYLKTEVPPGLEVAILKPSSGQLPVTSTPFGRLGAAIAFDMDFPAFLLQAGRKHVDVMVVPENEYPEIDPMHSRMALYRAVENGFNLLLHASQSLSLACDYQGRVYGIMDHYHAGDRVLVAQLPSRGVTTLYSRGGYLFPWLSIAGLATLMVVSLCRHSRSA